MISPWLRQYFTRSASDFAFSFTSIRASLDSSQADYNWATRVDAVLQRRRDYGEQTLEIALTGNESSQDAQAAFAQLLPAIVNAGQ